MRYTQEPETGRVLDEDACWICTVKNPLTAEKLEAFMAGYKLGVREGRKAGRLSKILEIQKILSSP